MLLRKNSKRNSHWINHFFQLIFKIGSQTIIRCSKNKVETNLHYLQKRHLCYRNQSANTLFL